MEDDTEFRFFRRERSLVVFYLSESLIYMDILAELLACIFSRATVSC